MTATTTINDQIEEAYKEVVELLQRKYGVFAEVEHGMFTGMRSCRPNALAQLKNAVTCMFNQAFCENV